MHYHIFYLNRTESKCFVTLLPLKFCLNDFAHSRFLWHLLSVSPSLSVSFFRRCTMCTNCHFIFSVRSMTGLFVDISTVIVSESAQKSPSSFCSSTAHLRAPYVACKNRCRGQCGKGIPELGVWLMILRYTLNADCS